MAKTAAGARNEDNFAHNVSIIAVLFQRDSVKIGIEFTNWVKTQPVGKQYGESLMLVKLIG